MSKKRIEISPFDRRLILATMGGIVALTLGVVIYFATDKGTLKIEGSEPGMVVRIDGQLVTIENVGELIAVRTGSHGLFIKRGDVVARAPETFEITRGKESVVRIDFTPIDKKKDEAAKPADPPPPAPAPKELTSREAPGLKLARIEAGDFVRGSDDGFADEKPKHKVTITKPFYLGIHEVMQGQWKAVMGEEVKPFYSGPATLPMEQVSWFDAVKFCNALSVKEGLEPYYTINGETVSIKGGTGYRLPTEAEWEYACRAGSTGKFTFGDDESKLGDYAWFDGNSKVGGSYTTHPVGGKQANAFGLYDMHGNVWEWCEDWYEKNYYAITASHVDPKGASAGTSRVLRGGSFDGGPVILRCAYRRWIGPANLSRDSGFRLARTYP